MGGADAAEFILLGSDTVQVCTGVMVHGYGLVKHLCAELQEFMVEHDFENLSDFKGLALDYFTTHMDLVARQKRPFSSEEEEGRARERRQLDRRGFHQGDGLHG